MLKWSFRTLPMFEPLCSLHTTERMGMHVKWVIACVPSPTFDASVEMASCLQMCTCRPFVYQPSVPKACLLAQVRFHRHLSNLHDLMYKLESLPYFNSLLLSEGISMIFWQTFPQTHLVLSTRYTVEHFVHMHTLTYYSSVSCDAMIHTQCGGHCYIRKLRCTKLSAGDIY